MDFLSGFVLKLPGKDLALFQFHISTFVLGGSAWIGLPVYKISYDSERWYRCLQIHMGFLFFFFDLNVPLFFDHIDGEPK